jgi:NhaP-type Na+/H+ or K+/H+ antiporter
MVPGIELWQAALVAVLLAPTDAALGQAVVTNTKVPVAIRESLSVESGLNDGIASPLVPLFIAGALIEGPTESSSFWVTTFEEVSLALAVGIIGGLAGAVLIGRASRLRLMTRTFQQISVAVLPILFLGLSEAIDGNAFIAAFVGGIVFGNVARHVPGRFFEFSEQASQVLLLVTFMLFGAMFASDAFDGLTWKVIVYAVLSLALIRPVTAAFSLLGTGFNWRTLAFMGWFGPRGLASIVFILIVLAEEGLPGSHQMFLAVAWTVAFSIFAHGLTAQPGAAWYGRHAAALPEGAAAPEMAGGDTFFLSTARLTSSLGGHGRAEDVADARPPSEGL